MTSRLTSSVTASEASSLPIPAVRPDLTADEALARLVARMGVRRACWHLAQDALADMENDPAVTDDKFYPARDALDALTDYFAAQSD